MILNTILGHGLAELPGSADHQLIREGLIKISNNREEGRVVLGRTN